MRVIQLAKSKGYGARDLPLLKTEQAEEPKVRVRAKQEAKLEPKVRVKKEVIKMEPDVGRQKKQLQDLDRQKKQQPQPKSKAPKWKGSVRRTLDAKLIAKKRYIIPKNVMEKIIRQIAEDIVPGVRMDPFGIQKLHEAAELYMDSLFHRAERARITTSSRKRRTLMPEDLRVVLAQLND